MSAPAIIATRDVDRKRLLVLWELRGWRIRLALAENDLAWAQTALAAGHIAAEGALAALDQALVGLTGDDDR